MNRTSGIVLFVSFCFLIWLYLAIYESSIENWWTVNEIKYITDDTVQIGVSLVKVLVGTITFTISGFVLYSWLGKRN